MVYLHIDLCVDHTARRGDLDMNRGYRDIPSGHDNDLNSTLYGRMLQRMRMNSCLTAGYIPTLQQRLHNTL